MRYIDLSIIDANDPDVKAWFIKARRRLNTLSNKTSHAERSKYLARANIWSDFKPILIKYYGDKCWYSECCLEGAFGDIDHFRPKNKSTDEYGKTILGDGYWWLAYDYLNYRLSCEKCNRSFGSGGKNDMFPLKEGTSPATRGNKNDIPILLDPCVCSDVNLIGFNESGEIVAITQNEYDKRRIDISKKIYNWNCFNSARREVRTKCKTALEIFEIVYESAPEKMEPALTQICLLVDHKSPYSSFARRYIAEKIEGKPFESVIRSIF